MPSPTPPTSYSAESRRIARYMAVGAFCASMDLALFMLFAQVLGLPYLQVAACTFTLATLLNYLLCVRFVFVSGERHTRPWEVGLVFLVSAIGLGLNTLILWLAVGAGGLPLLPAKVLATATVFSWNYLTRRHLVFAVR